MSFTLKSDTVLILEKTQNELTIAPQVRALKQVCSFKAQAESQAKL